MRAWPAGIGMNAQPPDPLRTSFLAMMFVASGVILTSWGLADPDLWGHIRFGNDILAHGIPATATYTFTATDDPWINHAYLSEVVFAVVERLLGTPGLLVLKTLLGLAIIGSMITRAIRHGASVLTTSIVVMLVANVAAPGWIVRPHLFTYAFFALVVLLLDGEATRGKTPAQSTGGRPGVLGRASSLWLLPPLFAVWANLHGGFVAAFLVVVLYLGSLGVEALWTGRPDAGRRLALYAGVVTASALATLLNPYGPDLHRWLWHASTLSRPEVTEWWPLWRYTHLGPVLALLALVALAWGFTQERRSFTQTVVLAVVIVQAVMHLRHVLFVALLAGYWLPPHLESVRLRLVKPRTRATPSEGPPPRALRVIRATFAAFSMGLTLLLAIHLRGIEVDRSEYPVAAFEYIARRNFSGRLAVFVDWGQYAIAAFAPRVSVGFDTRMDTCYPEHVVRMNYDFILGPRSHTTPDSQLGAEVLDHGNPDLALLNRRFPHAVNIVAQHPSWVLLYQDGLAQLWGRRDRYDDAASADFVPPDARVIGDEVQSGYVFWPALPANHTAESVRARRQGQSSGPA